jgi:DNA-binding HxlR family transcriptional regulator/putative sterol carrier protein
MVGRRKYDDGCAVSHALDLIGERWALLVVRELLLGPKRFTDLLAGVRGASPDVLTQRLRGLTETGVVRRRRLGPPAAAWVYELTDWGAELGPTVVGLARWANRSPGMRYDAPLGTDSAVLSLEALFDPDAAAGLDATIALRLGEEWFRIHIADGQLKITRGEIDHSDVTIDTDPANLLSLLRTNRRLDEALTSGDLRVAGDRALVEQFRRLFPTPQPIPADRQS